MTDRSHHARPSMHPHPNTLHVPESTLVNVCPRHGEMLERRYPRLQMAKWTCLVCGFQRQVSRR